jgi:competence protein ComEA
MPTNRVLLAAVTLALLSAPAFAQDKKPAPSAMPAPAVTASPPAAKPSTTGAATAPVTNKINLNTATAAALDKLPKIGPAQSKAIMEARGKSKFKSWEDFVSRKVVPSDTQAAIKDAVTF